MRPDPHSLLGELLAFCGLSSAAVLAFRDALHVRPASPARQLRLGEALVAAGRWLEAAACFESCARIEPWSIEANGSLVLALAKGGRPAATLVALRRFIDLTPGAAEPWILLGALERRVGRRHEAIRAFRWAARLPAGRRQRRFLLGEALLGARDWEQALAAHSHAAGAPESRSGEALGAFGSALNHAPGRLPAPREAARAAHGRLDRVRGVLVGRWRALTHHGLACVLCLEAAGRRALIGAHLRFAALAARRRPHVALWWLRRGLRLHPGAGGYSTRTLSEVSAALPAIGSRTRSFSAYSPGATPLGVTLTTSRR